MLKSLQIYIFRRCQRVQQCIKYKFESHGDTPFRNFLRGRIVQNSFSKSIGVVSREGSP